MTYNVSSGTLSLYTTTTTSAFRLVDALCDVCIVSLKKDCFVCIYSVGMFCCELVSRCEILRYLSIVD